MEKISQQRIVESKAAQAMFRAVLRHFPLSCDGFPREDRKVYTNALIRLVQASNDNAYRFMIGADVEYRGFVRNGKGKLVDCEAYFVQDKRV